MRVIMQKAKEESVDSIKIMQEHNWVVDFLKHDFEKIYNSVHKQDQQQLQQIAKNEINKFVINLRNHFLEEERIVFPLALRPSGSKFKLDILGIRRSTITIYVLLSNDSRL